MPTKELIVPPAMERIYNEYRYSPGIRIGGYIHIAGQVGRDADLNILADPEQQITQAWRNLGIVLEAAGAGYGDLVEIVSYHVDLKGQLALFKSVRDKFIVPGTTIPPTWTAIGVTELARPGLIVELKATAWKAHSG